MEEAEKIKELQFYKIPQIQENKTKTKVFFVYDNEDTYTKLIENSLYDFIKQDTEFFELITMGFQDSMSQFSIQDWRKVQNRQLFEGYNLQCSDKTKEYFAQQFSLYCKKDKLQQINQEKASQFKYFVLNSILEKILEKTIQLSQTSNLIVVLMMKSIECIGIRDLTKNFYPHKLEKSKILFIDTGDLDFLKKQAFVSDLFNKFPSDPSQAFIYEQIMPKNKPKTDESFLQFLELISQKIVQQLKFTIKLNAEKELQQFPWSKPSKLLNSGSVAVSHQYQGEWFLAKSDFQNHRIERLNNLDIESLVNIFTTWVNEIVQLTQIDAVGQEEIQEIQNYLENFLKYQMNEALNQNQEEITVGQKLTVKQRFLSKQRNQIKFQVQLLIKSLKDLSGENNLLDQLSDEQLKERQKIGTIVGKFHQRAIQMQGLDVQEFLKIKENFAAKLRQVQKEINPDSDEVRSIITLENFKDIILQEDIFDAIGLIQNQYNLISSFPLVGLGVKLQRTNGSMINPYLVKVIDIARINQYVDTISIQNTPDKKLILNAGYETDQDDYNTQIKETIDAVVPLFGPKDYDLKPLLQSKFFHVLNTFNVMNNVDTIFQEAYFALLANTLIYLLNEEKSDFITDLLDKIYHSVCIVYSESKFFVEFCKMLVTNPRLSMVTYHEGHPTQCQGPSKGLLVLFYLVKKGELTDRVLIKEILEAIMQEIVARGIKNPAKMTSYFEVNGFDVEKLKDFGRKTVNKYIDRVLEFPTVRQMMMEVESTSRIDEVFSVDKSYRLRLNKKKFEYLNFGKYNFFVSLKNICEYFLSGEKFKGEILWFWLYHIQRHNNSYVRNSTPLMTDIKKVYRTFKAQKINKIMNVKFEKVMQICQQKLQAVYKEKMAPLHINIKPVSHNQLFMLLRQKEVKITFNNVSNLAKKFCLCPECPFYLKKLNHLSEHIKDANFCIPAFCKTIKIMKYDNPNLVLHAIKVGDCLDRDDEKKYVLAYNKLSEYIDNDYFTFYEDKIMKTIRQCQLIYRKL
ncbi:zinc-binding dehydrogenase family oxidoreductase (macronuclear) [Tetrahymena thermophila SB210]|uniref:Zinc-binding dehydrogenase family oxidoreductase n=1 Tax=Tetrahymena thermophila (strain SB210) TaxID=312017 RepID=Q23G04_TETTS|nr:zinc-binding dehydrogenase family oxidoreductase [Tetrahymena thermophila SB210]EAR95456.3 zinc-binding dehydrogenase family oxidoreductase [Tetrahymena thermophila SB210]|eukprot:XP_001015701.3 zinc-binding dehydrogenase family oxidoreductase [Tetrahymena thermophila SB210]